MSIVQGDNDELRCGPEYGAANETVVRYGGRSGSKLFVNILLGPITKPVLFSYDLPVLRTFS